MTALDTNVLVRYLTQDDEAQFLKVLQMLNRKKATFFAFFRLSICSTFRNCASSSWVR